MASKSRPSRQPQRAGASKPPKDAPAAGPQTALGKLADVAGGQRDRRERLIAASNWRTPLVIDIVLGCVVLLIGLALSIAWNPIGGGGIGALGAIYALLAMRRWRKWAELREAAGLPVKRAPARR